MSDGTGKTTALFARKRASGADLTHTKGWGQEDQKTSPEKPLKAFSGPRWTLGYPRIPQVSPSTQQSTAPASAGFSSRPR